MNNVFDKEKYDDINQSTMEKALINEIGKVLFDSDNDGIPDQWEINGYTVENGVIVAWDDLKHENKGFVKYFSDPYDAYTSGGPYSDAEKVLGKIDALKEARNPLVATYPKINVEMEKFILSKNINISQEKEQTIGQERTNTVGIATNNSHTDSKSVAKSITAEVHASLFDIGASVSVSGNFSNETSNTITTEKNSSTAINYSLGTNIINSLSLNQSEVAFLNGNIRYVNFGTAPIYNLKPTINFVLGIGKSENTIATLCAKTNTVAKVVLPEEKYPISSQNALSWNTSDDFNSQPIKLNYNQVLDLVNWKPLQVETTQIEGEYKKYDITGEQFVSQSFKWEYVLPDIYRKTAVIIIAFNNGKVFERRVVAVRWRQLKNPQITLPRLTIKAAIEIAFAGAKVKDNQIHYKNKVLDKNNLHIIIDKHTNEIIKLQYVTNFFETILTKEMKIMFIEEEQTQNFEIFKIIKEKLKNFDGKTYFNCLDLKNEISFDTNLGVSGIKLTQIIKKYLLIINIPLSIVDKIIFNWTYGFGNHKNIYSLREDHWNLLDPKGWYKTVNLKYNELTTENFQIHFKNILFNKIEDITNILNHILNILKKFNKTNRFDLKNIIHSKTDLGIEGQYLKEIIKSYLVVKLMFGLEIINNVEIIFLTLKNNSFNQEQFKIDDDNTWFISTKIKFYNEWESEVFPIYFKNIRTLNNFSNGFIEGFENYFKKVLLLPKNEKITEIAKVFNMIHLSK